MPVTLAEVADATGGRVVGDPATTFEGFVTDTRRPVAGALFVALRGERFDGHDFVGTAAAQGAAAVLVESAEVEPRVEVADTLQALIDMAAAVRSRITAPVVAITGSSGKTSTKDLLAAALGPGAWASERSFNNEIGVPLTVLAAPPAATVLIVEVGSRGAGHIRRLLPVVRPDVAVITNVGVAHYEFMGEGIVAAKLELLEGLGPDGVAVVPAADARLQQGPVRTFGSEPDADVGIEELVIDHEGYPSFTLKAGAQQARVRLRMAGVHQAQNAAAAAAAGLALGRQLPELAAGMSEAVGSPWRMEVHTGAFTVVNDAYNANPDSMAAALRTVASMPGRKVAVLGKMEELGPVEQEQHVAVGELAAALGFMVVVVGDDPGLAMASGAKAVADKTAAESLLNDLIRPGDVVLVKASRAAGLEALAGSLAARAGEAAT